MATRKKPVKKAKPAQRNAARPRAERKKAAQKPAKPDRRTTARPKLDELGIEWFCQQVADENSLTAIAKKIEVSIGTLLTWIDADTERSARAREARSSMAKLYDERATEGIEAAKNAFELAKAKEMAHHWRWRASKIAPKEYGEKLAVGGSGEFGPLQVVVQKFGGQ